MELIIKKVELEKYAQKILEIVQKTFVRDFDFPTKEVQEVHDYLRGSEVFGVFDSERLVGYSAFHQHAHGDSELKSIALLSEYQGKGFGKMMLKKAIDENKGRMLWLVVHPRNSGAIITYLKAGFVITGWKENPFGDGQPRLEMQRLQ